MAQMFIGFALSLFIFLSVLSVFNVYLGKTLKLVDKSNRPLSQGVIYQTSISDKHSASNKKG